MLYNLGRVFSVGIRDLSDYVNNAAEKIGLEKVPIRIEPGKEERKLGMDTALFRRGFNWRPCVFLRKWIELVQSAQERNLFVQS